MMAVPRAHDEADANQVQQPASPWAVLLETKGRFGLLLEAVVATGATGVGWAALESYVFHLWEVGEGLFKVIGNTILDHLKGLAVRHLPALLVPYAGWVVLAAILFVPALTFLHALYHGQVLDGLPGNLTLLIGLPTLFVGVGLGMGYSQLDVYYPSAIVSAAGALVAYIRFTVNKLPTIMHAYENHRQTKLAQAKKEQEQNQLNPTQAAGVQPPPPIQGAGAAADNPAAGPPGQSTPRIPQQPQKNNGQGQPPAAPKTTIALPHSDKAAPPPPIVTPAYDKSRLRPRPPIKAIPSPTPTILVPGRDERHVSRP